MVNIKPLLLRNGPFHELPSDAASMEVLPEAKLPNHINDLLKNKRNILSVGLRPKNWLAELLRRVLYENSHHSCYGNKATKSLLEYTGLKGSFYEIHPLL